MGSNQICKIENAANINSSPILNVFGIPQDKNLTLQRTHFEVTKLLDNKTQD